MIRHSFYSLKFIYFFICLSLFPFSLRGIGSYMESKAILQPSHQMWKPSHLPQDIAPPFRLSKIRGRKLPKVSCTIISSTSLPSSHSWTQHKTGGHFCWCHWDCDGGGHCKFLAATHWVLRASGLHLPWPTPCLSTWASPPGPLVLPAHSSSTFSLILPFPWAASLHILHGPLGQTHPCL